MTTYEYIKRLNKEETAEMLVNIFYNIIPYIDEGFGANRKKDKEFMETIMEMNPFGKEHMVQ